MPAATPSQPKPRIALTVGDPAGIGPELIVRLLSSPDIAARAHVTLIGNRPGLERAARAAKVAVPSGSDWLGGAALRGLEREFGPRRRTVFRPLEQRRDAPGRHG